MIMSEKILVRFKDEEKIIEMSIAAGNYGIQKDVQKSLALLSWSIALSFFLLIRDIYTVSKCYIYRHHGSR